MKITLLIICALIFTCSAYYFTVLTLNSAANTEAEKLGGLGLAFLKNEIQKYTISEDDITLNNSLINLAKHPDILKISVSHKDRIIADSNPGDINTKSSPCENLTSEKIKNKIFFQNETITAGKKEYTLTLKLKNNSTKALKETMAIRLIISCFVFLLLAFTILFRRKERPALPIVPAKKETTDLLRLEAAIFESNSAVILILAGDNTVINASSKAFDIFGHDIKGRAVTELNNFDLITGYFSSGKKPLLIDGNKYFIL